MVTQSMGSLLFEAASLMLTGMVFVFMFLALLIVGIKVITAYCSHYPGPEPKTDRKNSALSKPANAEKEGVDSRVMAAITAAIHQHRQKNH